MSVATGAAAVANRLRRPRLLITLLAVSLALNLCFVAGAVWSRMHAPPALGNIAEHYRQMAGQLNLDPQQRAAFDRYVTAMRTRIDQMRQQTDPAMAAAWDEMAKPQLNAAEVSRLLDEAAEKRRIFQQEAASQTLALLSTLSPEQRAKFVALVRERRAAWRQAHPGGS